jgi:hypothetical protein
VKRWGGKTDVFIFDWRDDPRKDQAWYDKQCRQFDPVTVCFANRTSALFEITLGAPGATGIQYER